jgi:hypothetical protein
MTMDSKHVPARAVLSASLVCGFLGVTASAAVADPPACGHPMAVAERSALTLADGCGPDEGWRRLLGDASLAVTDERAPTRPKRPHTDPAVTKRTPSGRYFVRDTSPDLTAVLPDQGSGLDVSGHFEVFEVSSGARVFDTWSAEVAAGAEVTITVDVLEENVRYKAIVTAQDTDGVTSQPSRGRFFKVDVTRPGTPDVRPVAGGDAIYEEGKTGGGIGQSGRFRLLNRGDRSFAHFEYTFDNWTTMLSTPKKHPVIEWTPTQAGEVVLETRMVDAAGNRSLVEDTYIFGVAFPKQSAAWFFDEAPGSTTAKNYAEDAAPGSDLFVPTNVTWVAGRALYGMEDQYPPDDPSQRDGGLMFTANSSVVATDVAMIDTTKDFTIVAYVRPTALSTTMAAVSQPGANVSGFGLGLVADDPECPYTGGCWEFWMPSKDSTTSKVMRARSTFEPVADRWVMLLGNFHNGKISLDTCHYPSEYGEEDHEFTKITWGSWETGPANPWAATGTLRVGSSWMQGLRAQQLRGAIDRVRIYPAPVSEPNIKRIC